MVSGTNNFDLGPGETRQVALGFTPPKQGTFKAQFPVTSNDPKKGVVFIPLTGRGRR